MQTTETKQLFGLPVIPPCEARERKMKSMTTGVHSKREADIMRGIADRRDPARFAWVRTGQAEYQLYGVPQNDQHQATAITKL